MTLHETIKKSIIDAMRAKDQVRLDVLRSLTSLFMSELIAKGSTETLIDDESALTIIRRSVKQHKDSIEQFTQGNRPDLVEKEAAELVVLESYLPAMMSSADIEAYIVKKIAETRSVDKAKLGQFIGTLMKELKGKADGSLVKSTVEKLVQ